MREGELPQAGTGAVFRPHRVSCHRLHPGARTASRLRARSHRAQPGIRGGRLSKSKAAPVRSLAKSVPDIKAVATVKSAYTIALSPLAIVKLDEMKDLVEYAAEQPSLAVDVTIDDAASDVEGKNLLVNLRKCRKTAEDLQ